MWVSFDKICRALLGLCHLEPRATHCINWALLIDYIGRIRSTISGSFDGIYGSLLIEYIGLF